MEIYDLVTPKDNLLRQIKELVDFEFVYDELIEKYCPDNGRNAVPPIRMFKYLNLQLSQSAGKIKPAGEETIHDDMEHLKISKDEDAKIGHKTADTSFFGYKTHIAMTEKNLSLPPQSLPV